jgi:hypothetical protein
MRFSRRLLWKVLSSGRCFLLSARFIGFPTLKMEAVFSSKTSAVYHTTQRYFPAYSFLHAPSDSLKNQNFANMWLSASAVSKWTALSVDTRNYKVLVRF